ncbi:MAG: CDP-glycerol glycerophosphotransferase family protein [Firmicutes bacterium]|nr:CDP-glycerol glycerophosphotransferase family protein [Bacillota bacterium]
MKRKIRKAAELTAFYLYNRISGKFRRLDDRKVVFASEARDSLKGNLKAVYDKMPEDFEKVIHLKGDRRDGESAGETLRLWRDLTTAKYILLDDFYGLISTMKVRKGQEIVQLWHGAGAFKKFGFSRVGTGDNITNVHTGYRKYTKAAVTAEPIRGCFAEAFDIDIEKVQAVGNPRTDVFFDEEAKKAAADRVYKAYPQLKDKKVVLIAPTYRGRKVEDADYAFDKLQADKIAEELGNEYTVAVKWHPALYNNIKRGICEFNADGVTDTSSYSDINDLLVIADVLVTDYSSVIFDWYLMDKPVVYFTYDLADYESGRGLYYEFREYVYGTVAENCRDLITAIKDAELCADLRDAFGEKFMSACDGKSTERVIAWITGREY